MFTRIVSMQLKVNGHKPFSELFHSKIIPTLREQKGFKDVMLLVTPGAPEVVALSIWDSREAAEKYEHQVFPKLEQSLSPLTERRPEVKTFALAYSTMHKIPASEVAAFEKQSPTIASVPGVGGG